MDSLTDDDWDVMSALSEVIESNATPSNIRGLRKVNYDFLDSFLGGTDVPKGTTLSELADNINKLSNHTYLEQAFTSISIDPEKTSSPTEEFGLMSKFLKVQTLICQVMRKKVSLF